MLPDRQIARARQRKSRVGVRERERESSVLKIPVYDATKVRERPKQRSFFCCWLVVEEVVEVLRRRAPRERAWEERGFKRA